MFSIKADTQSFENLDKILKRLHNEMEKHVIAESLVKAAEVVEEEAKASASFRDDTGELRRSIRVREHPAERPKGRGRNAKDVVLEATAPYAAAVELGHGGPRPAPPHPYLEPALRSRQRAAATAAQREATRNMRRAVKASERS